MHEICAASIEKNIMHSFELNKMNAHELTLHERETERTQHHSRCSNTKSNLCEPRFCIYLLKYKSRCVNNTRAEQKKKKTNQQ